MPVNKRMLIKKYTSHQVKNFTILKPEIDKGLSRLTYEIQHVGSTSLPELDSKSIIDIIIVYKTNRNLKK